MTPFVRPFGQSFFALTRYGMQLITVVATWFLNIWLGERVALNRKKNKVPLPLMYAHDGIEDGKNAGGLDHNKRQRGHQNMLESIADVYVGMLIAGLHRPVITAVLNVLFIVGRALYAVFYSQAPKRRVYGSVFFLVARIGHLYIVGEIIYALLQSKA